MASAPSSAPPSVRIPKRGLTEFALALLTGAGASPTNANVVVEHLIEADTMGLTSHGVIRLPQYLADIASGGIDPGATPRISQLAFARAMVDGRGGFGQIVGMAMAAEGVRLARAAGVSFVCGRHMGHTGRIGAYAEAIARCGAVGIVVCSGPRSGHRVAPFGGLEGRLATNPIAFAYPVRDSPPVVGDFSTSVAPEGVIRSLMNRGLSAPEGALRDGRGIPSIDPAILYQSPPGSLQPLGGAVGYRGTALALLVEVLAALLAEDDTEDRGRLGSNLAMLAVSTDGAFAERAGRMAAYVRSSPAIESNRPVMLPGEREHRVASRSGEGPISVDGPIWDLMVAAAGDRLAVPAPVAD